MSDVNIPVNPSSTVDQHTAIAGANVDGLIRGSTISNMINRPSYDGKLDQYGEVRLRLGIIDNPMIKRTKEGKIDPMDPYNVVNMTTGNVTIRWIEQEGGIVRPGEFGVYGKEGESSDREPIKLTHPMIWANEKNWCGINYLPPVGSVAIIGFRKHNIPVLLGFLQSHYQLMHPLELGEMMNKGFGNNTSHWKMNDEQEHKAWVIKGSDRPVAILDAPGRKYKWEEAPYTVRLKFRLKAWIDPKNPSDKKELIEMMAIRETESGSESSYIELRPEVVRMTSDSNGKGSSIEVKPTSVSVTSDGDITLNAGGALNLKGGRINLN